nr:ATP-binding protein [Actinomadura roseirufa]
MSVRNAMPRVRPHVRRPTRARVTLVATGLVGSLLVVAGIVTAGVLRVLIGPHHDTSLAAATAALCAVALPLVAWSAWHAAGGVLRPLEEFEAELDEILTADLGRRLDETPGDPSAGLAHRMNAVLDRLEDAAVRRRAFIADASHELRTPLTGLRARIELALVDPAEADLVETLRYSLRDTERLHRIVEDLFALARMDSGEEPARERIDLGALVEGELAHRAPPVPVTAKVESGVGVEANRLQLSRVLLNLLANAERHAVATIEVEVRGEGAEAVVEVRDDGPGVPPADRDRIFERFSRLDTARDRAAGGSGLGLAIAREIAVGHGGRLYVADTAHGARLVLRLPLRYGNGDASG